jgi:hypothetical protein
MLITRPMEDFVTWVDTSARKRTIMKYNDEVRSEIMVLEAIKLTGSLSLMTLTCFRWVGICGVCISMLAWWSGCPTVAPVLSE